MASVSCIVLLLLVLGSVAQADNSNNVDQQKADLFAELASASSELEGRTAEDAIWRIWFDQSPTDEVRGWIDAGLERRGAYDFEAAEMLFDKAVKAAPEYAEAYNQRAFIRFLREKYPLAQSDLEKTLELEPKHFGAMAGLFHVHFRLNQADIAMELLQQAVTIHPWLKERSMLPKPLWPDAYRRLHDPDQEI